MKAVDPDEIFLEEMIEQATEFHGHLGPFLVLGIRMGLLALRELNSPGYEGIEALVKTGNTPSLSCLLDGIQISTGCTMGKGNIATVSLGRAEADFSADEKRVTFRVRDEIVDEIKSWRESYSALEEIARSISNRSDEELFERL
jgi:formylmethanofuran dehydrogenase subunit E